MRRRRTGRRRRRRAVSILTTAGPTLAAASMTADDSSMVTGCWEPVCVPVAIGRGRARRWSKAPARSRTSTVPPEARTADSTETVTIVPRPAARRPPGFSGVVATGAGGAQAGAGAGGRGSPWRARRVGRGGVRAAGSRRSGAGQPGRGILPRARARGIARRRPGPAGVGSRIGGRARSGGPRRAACRRADRVGRRPGERPPRDRRSWLRGSSLWLRGRCRRRRRPGSADQGCRNGIHRRAFAG